MKKIDPTGASPLRIIPLGGLEQIGMNITAFETDDSIFILDCGLGFPEDDMLGVDLVIPDDPQPPINNEFNGREFDFEEEEFDEEF
jgi:mRNA degradation ribonuclease J1/J2